LPAADQVPPFRARARRRPRTAHHTTPACAVTSRMPAAYPFSAVPIAPTT